MLVQNRRYEVVPEDELVSGRPVYATVCGFEGKRRIAIPQMELANGREVRAMAGCFDEQFLGDWRVAAVPQMELYQGRPVYAFACCPLGGGAYGYGSSGPFSASSQPSQPSTPSHPSAPSVPGSGPAQSITRSVASAPSGPSQVSLASGSHPSGPGSQPSGASAPSGPSGPSGASGASGQSGASAPSAASGASVPSQASKQSAASVPSQPSAPSQGSAPSGPSSAAGSSAPASAASAASAASGSGIGSFQTVSGNPCKECTSGTSPYQVEVSFSGLAQPPGGCALCNQLNATFILTYHGTGANPCAWQYGPPIPCNTQGVIEFEFFQGIWQLLVGVNGNMAIYKGPATWDCASALTLSLFSSANNICNNWPATITVTPV